ncbi:hypothetical protein ACWE42_12370 [Sutcliffiella cohnii]
MLKYTIYTLLISILLIWTTACEINENTIEEFEIEDKIDDTKNTNDSVRIIYQGESDNWAIDLNYYYYDRTENIEYTIRYVGTDIPPKTIDYKVADITSTGTPLNNNGFIQSKNNLCEDCINKQNISKINAEIIWNGKEESLILQPKDLE